MPEPTPIAPRLPDEPTTGDSFNFSCDVPLHPDCGSILAKDDRVVILEKKYSHATLVPGIVKGFVSNEILVQRRDGEGLHERKELHLVR